MTTSQEQSQVKRLTVGDTHGQADPEIDATEKGTLLLDRPSDLVILCKNLGGLGGSRLAWLTLCVFDILKVLRRLELLLVECW